jgi:hypothetical protein
MANYDLPPIKTAETLPNGDVRRGRTIRVNVDPKTIIDRTPLIAYDSAGNSYPALKTWRADPVRFITEFGDIKLLPWQEAALRNALRWP